jgi:2'-hydroxyisoflavone reductase
MLILGGTGFIGPHLVRAAVERGHKAAVFNRGETHANLPESVEHLRGDRKSNLESIKNRDWDAVIDLPTLVPAWVRSVGEALKGRAKHYTFISTTAVYADFADALKRLGGNREHPLPASRSILTETSPLMAYQGPDPYTVDGPKGLIEYGALKALCEREAQQQFPGSTLILRPCYIFGPGMLGPSAAFYWPARLRQGGEVLVGGDPITPEQFVDVRDLMAWAVRMIEKKAAGIYNAVPPSCPELGKLISGVSKAMPTPASHLTWVPSEWLASREDRQTWDKLLFWSFEAEGAAPLARVSGARAKSEGFTARSAVTTLLEISDWYQQQPPARQAELLALKKKAGEAGGFEPLESAWPDYLAQERKALTAWLEEKAKKS